MPQMRISAAIGVSGMLNISSINPKKIGNISRIFAQKTYQTIKKYSQKHLLEVCFCVIMAGFSFLILFPTMVSADGEGRSQTPNDKTVALVVESMQNETKPFGKLPVSKDAQPRKSITVPITAYSSEPWQTDSTPFITASGTRVRDGIVAANFLPIGTRVRIPELYGDKVFIVEDRMNKRYWHRMDIWMKSTEQARKFGVKRLKVEIFPRTR